MTAERPPRPCDHDGCFRLRAPGSAYCCSACEARDLLGFTPSHNEDCAAVLPTSRAGEGQR